MTTHTTPGIHTRLTQAVHQVSEGMGVIAGIMKHPDTLAFYDVYPPIITLVESLNQRAGIMTSLAYMAGRDDGGRVVSSSHPEDFFAHTFGMSPKEVRQLFIAAKHLFADPVDTTYDDDDTDDTDGIDTMGPGTNTDTDSSDPSLFDEGDDTNTGNGNTGDDAGDSTTGDDEEARRRAEEEARRVEEERRRVEEEARRREKEEERKQKKREAEKARRDQKKPRRKQQKNNAASTSNYSITSPNLSMTFYPVQKLPRGHC